MRWLIALLAGLALLLGGCASDSDSSARTTSPDDGATEVVTAVKSYRFEPETLEVSAGTEVQWTNEDDFPHNVHFLSGRDDTLDLPIGESVSTTFDEAGEFAYECSLHLTQMKGTIVVQ